MIVERRLKVVIPEDHRIVVDVPEDVPAGPAELILMIERPGGTETEEVAASESAKARFVSLADELAADPRPFRDLSQEERKARLGRVVGIGRELFSPSEEIARRKEEEIGLEAWHRVYEGLPEDQIAEVEAIALDRSHFSALTSQAGASSDEVRRFPPRSE
ncbi:MAG: hypothetical protein JF614_27565 [Acidobacteria bacterium]|nr:hypothetical protein [Acidobacteriota bacterium]